MKVVCTSDTHNRMNSVTPIEGDILIHAGDATSMGTPGELEKFGNDLRRFLYYYDKIIFVPGNHDLLFESNRGEASSYIPEEVIILIDEMYQYKGYKIFGSPYSLEYSGKWAFKLERQESYRKWKHLPDDIDILITHGPPFGYGDFVEKEGLVSQHVGCGSLRNRIEELEELKLHVCGHIHEAYGRWMFQGASGQMVSVVNPTFHGPRLTPGNKPIVVEV